MKKQRKSSSPKMKHYKYYGIPVNQGKCEMILFKIKADILWSIVAINKRDPDKNTGYQRVLSPSRVSKIADYIKKGNTIPNSILIAFDEDTKYDETSSIIAIPNRPDSGWVIDGQHRLAGAYESGTGIELIVVAFINLPEKGQINQFVTINREAKGVPTSLYYDLLKSLPSPEKEADIAREKAADIASIFRKDENSPFYGRLTIISTPKKGEISLNNFVRKIYSLLLAGKGKFHLYTLQEQTQIIHNYYVALSDVFPQYISEDQPLFFQTIGFGALINVLPTVFDLTMKQYNGFRVEDIVKTLKPIEDFGFDNWREIGSGSNAELLAAEDLRATLLYRSENNAGGKSIRL